MTGVARIHFVQGFRAITPCKRMKRIQDVVKIMPCYSVWRSQLQGFQITGPSKLFVNRANARKET